MDSFSTISLLFFSVGLIIFLVQDGAFDSVVYGFKRFARAVRRNQLEDSDEEAPLTELKRHDGKKRAALTWPLIIDSLLLFALAFSVSLLM
nr:DUF3899 domain-containing protein [Sporolactobacillus mangiferae]